MPSPEYLQLRLHALESYLTVLRSLQRYSREEFLASPVRYGGAERYLQLALQSLHDMGAYVIAEEQLGAAETYPEVVQRLAAAGYIDDRLERTWLLLVGFRNYLVHDYLYIDRSLVYDVLQHRVEHMAELRQMFAKFM